MPYSSYASNACQALGTINFNAAWLKGVEGVPQQTVVARAFATGLKELTKLTVHLDQARQMILIHIPRAELSTSSSNAGEIEACLKSLMGHSWREAVEGWYVVLGSSSDLVNEMSLLYSQAAGGLIPWVIVRHRGGEDIVDTRKIARLSSDGQGNLTLEYNDRILTLNFGEGGQGIGVAREYFNLLGRQLPKLTRDQ